MSAVLTRELGAQAPDGLAALSDEDRAAFARILQSAKARQSSELEAAIEESLGVVPRLLRGTIRKVLFG